MIICLILGKRHCIALEVISEGPGIHLFADIFGDYYAILGLPMMALFAPVKTTWLAFDAITG